MTKVLLVVPPGGYYAERWRHGVLMPPLGVTYLATFLREKGIEAAILDAHVERLSPTRLRNRIRSSRAGIVGVTFTTETRFQGFQTIRIAREALPDSLIVAGGPHASLAAGDTLRHLEPLDVIVRGEGEQALAELVRAAARNSDLSAVRGISFREKDNVVNTPNRPLIENLDELPIPDRSLLRWGKYNFKLDVPGEGQRPAANLITSRGCPFGCCFCASSEMWGGRVRSASPERVVEEAQRLTDTLGVKAFWFCDDTFTLDGERVKRICELLKENCPGIKWFCEVRSGTVDRDLLGEMQEAGCCRIGFGIESGSQRVLDESTGKRIRVEEATELAAWCRELGIAAHPFFILSHPGETPADARKTMRLIRRLEKDHETSLSLMHIYPGTPLERMAKKNGILPPDFSWAQTNPQGAALLPCAQGDAPIFLDRLTWGEIGELLSEWKGLRRHLKLRELPRVLTGIRSTRDLRRHLILLRSLLRGRLRNIRIWKPPLSLARVALGRFGSNGAGFSPLPLRLWIEATNICNLKCVMCPQSITPLPNRGYMELDLFREIIDQAAGHVRDVTVHHRGESLLHPDIFRMIEYATGSGLRVRLHTNATLLNEEKSARLLGAGLDFLSFSFDAFGKNTYEQIRRGARFDETLENVRRFLAMKGERGARKPFTQIEILDIRPAAGLARRRLKEQLRSLPIDRIVVKKPHNWAGSWRRERRTIVPRTPCLFPWFSLVVLWNGDVVPCPQDFEGRLLLGNLRRESLREIWHGERIEEIRIKLKQRRFDELFPCRQCDMLARPGIFGVPLSSAATVLDDIFLCRFRS